jgi:TIR domain
MPDSDNMEGFEYDFCLSFAGEQRTYVEEVASELKSRGIRVFFDDYEKAELWGKDLYAHLDEVYQHLGRYCILFASADYARKVWTSHERRSAQARALKEKQEYILPARFDDTPIPGLPDTVHYVDLRNTTPRQLADLAAAKLGGQERHNYFPPVPDRLFERLGIQDDEEVQGYAQSQALGFFQALRRMTREEREVVLTLIRFGCPADLPANVHINVDLLRRLTGKSVARLKRILGGIKSLGFACSVREATEEEAQLHGETLGNSYMFELNWLDLSDNSGYPALVVAHEMVLVATENYCEEHSKEFLERLDFSQLASATVSEEATVKPTPSNIGLQPTPYSLNSYLASASRRG